jgi:DNA-binding NarL/FixJ family response regulator
MRVAIADDSALFRDGLAHLLHAAHVEVAVQAASGDELMARLSSDLPDVAILDIRMPPNFNDEGLVIARQLRERYPAVGILVLSAYAETPHAAQLVEIDSRGVGYLLKDRVTDITTLVDALKRISAGEAVIDEGIVQRLLDRQHEADRLARLTPREQEILALMAEGRSNAGIGNRLSITPRTVEAPIAEIFRKLGFYAAPDNNRRVLAVLTWLRAVGHDRRPGSE